MKNVKELVAGWKLEFRIDPLDSSHCLKHGYRRTKCKKFSHSEIELRVFDH